MIGRMFFTLLATLICTFIVDSIVSANSGNLKFKGGFNVLYCIHISLMTALTVAGIWSS